MPELFVLACGMTTPEFSANHAHEMACFRRINLDKVQDVLDIVIDNLMPPDEGLIIDVEQVIDLVVFGDDG